VLSNSLRAALLAGALSLLALIGGPIASAGATVTASHISSPADPAYVLYDQSTETSESVLLTVKGTTTGEGKVDLRCYYGKEAGSYRTLAEAVEPVANAFSVEVKAKSLYQGPCVLRAVPNGDKEAHEPGSASPFQGPRVITSEFDFFTEGSSDYGYELEANTLSSNLDIESAGDCGLDYSSLFAPTSLTESDHLFDCSGALYQYDPATEKRSETLLDGVNAYGPSNAHWVQNALGVTIPGAPQADDEKLHGIRPRGRAARTYVADERLRSGGVDERPVELDRRQSARTQRALRSGDGQRRKRRRRLRIPGLRQIRADRQGPASRPARRPGRDLLQGGRRDARQRRRAAPAGSDRL